VVDDGVAGDAVGKRVETVLDAQLSEASVKPQQHLLGHIVGGLLIGDSRADKPAEARVEVFPEPVCDRDFVGCPRRPAVSVYWHPQLPDARSSLQQSAFSEGSQQVACTAGLQQDAGGRSGAGAGVVSVWSSIAAPLVRLFNRADEEEPKGMQVGAVETAIAKA